MGKVLGGLSSVEAEQGPWKRFWGAESHCRRTGTMGEVVGSWRTNGETSVFGTRVQAGRDTQTSRARAPSNRKTTQKEHFWVHSSIEKEQETRGSLAAAAAKGEGQKAAPTHQTPILS